tara:strand:+ start:2128 stop:2805 length:678 start_codon:yes stop_codon:yes gene_type:complete
MDQQPIVDHAQLGIDPQYSPAQQHKIRRLILEDWKKVGVKLPTYMKLVARYIDGSGIPEAWLARLSHQTMDKMLKSVSTPRYEFWACLHLYLTKKYADLSISETERTDIELLGQALARFGGETEEVEGTYRLDGEAETALTISREAEEPFARIHLIRRYCSEEPFAEAVFTPCHGVGSVRDGKLTAIIRDITSRTIASMDIEMVALEKLEDVELEARLDALRDTQ